MNEEILIAISGIGLVIVFSLPFIAVPVIVYKLYQRSRAAKEKTWLGTQAGGPPQELPVRARRSNAALVTLSVLVIIYGLMTGFVMGVLSNLLYIVFLFPFAIGIFNGSLIADLAHKTKIRNVSHLLILSLLSAAAIYGMLHYGRYTGLVVRASMEFSTDVSDALEDQNLSVAKVLVDYAMSEETGHPGFLGYMLYQAREGVSIGRITRSSSFNLGPLLTWLYWLLELAIISGVTVQRGRSVIARAFCESCGNWVSGEKHLGGTTFANESFLLSLLRQKDFAGLGSLMEPNAEVPSLEVYYQGCQVCGRSQSQLVVRRTFQNTKGLLEFSDACQTTLQPAESLLLLNQFSFGGG